MINNYFIYKNDRSYIMGLSIIAVFLFHIFYFSNVNRNADFIIFTKGYLGVDVFFVLSTYGLCFSYERNTLKQFYNNRIKRIYPLYFIFLLLVYFLYNEPTFLYKSFVYQTTGLSTFYYFGTNVEWYTPSLILTYILFPILYHIGEKVQKMNILVILLIINIFAIIAYKLIPYMNDLYVNRIPIIISGVIIYFLQRNQRGNDAFQLILLLCIESLILNRHIMSMYTLLLIYLFKYIKYRPCYNIISFIGKYSFELYLAQVITTLYYMKTSSIENTYLVMLYAFLLTIPLFYSFILINKLSYRYLYNFRG